MRLSERAAFMVDNLNLPVASGVADARWEFFQLDYLSDDSPFRIENKSRQIAWSFTSAADALARAVLYDESTQFVSISLDEAAEKIRYARACYDSLEITGLPRIIRDNLLAVEFANNARLISHSSRPPRGKARMNVVLDEFAHVRYDRDIYRAALPVISKGGVLRVGSSPQGAGGVFWEICEQSIRQYPGFKRITTPWWAVHSFCIDVKAARANAPMMDTQVRVETYGTPRIQAIFDNMVLEDFQQEYECTFVDESTAWITWEAIQRNQAAFEAYGARWHRARDTTEASAIVASVRRDIDRGKIEPVLYGGIDIGRKHDLTEFIGVGQADDGALPLRIMVSLDRVAYDEQEALLEAIITGLPFAGVLVDRNGIGAQLAENLERTGRAQGVDFTNKSKALWAVEARLQAERGKAPMPVDRDLGYQIHSIKKIVTSAKNVVFDTAANEKHHADKFWAWALAIWAAHEPGVVTVGNPFYD